MPDCATCKKNFTEQTIKSYDGKNCGRCYAKLQENIPEEKWYSPMVKAFQNFNLREENANKSEPIARNYVKISEPAKTRATIPKAVRDKVWKIWIGDEMRGKCYVCDKDIWFTDFHCAHITADVLGGEVTVENLRPSCPTCNMSMGTHDLIEFAVSYGMQPDNYRIQPIKVKDLLLRIPPIWNRRIVLKILNEQIKNVEFLKWISYITWMIFDLPDNIPEHIAMLLLLKKISVVNKKPSEVLPEIIKTISEIWEEWHVRFKLSVSRDIRNYEVYLSVYDAAISAGE